MPNLAHLLALKISKVLMDVSLLRWGISKRQKLRSAPLVLMELAPSMLTPIADVIENGGPKPVVIVLIYKIPEGG